MSDQTTIIIGSYTEPMPHVMGRGEGISVQRIDAYTGSITPVSTCRELHNPTYLAFSRDGNMLYAVEELDEKDGAGAAVLRFDAATGELSVEAKVAVYGDAPCHISLDNQDSRLFIGNYGSGNFVTYPLGSNGLPAGDCVDIRRSGSGPNPDRQEGPHVHQVVASPDGLHVLVCDAGTDEITRHSIANGLIDPVPDHVTRTTAGSLPRHLVFSLDGDKVFVLHELANTISTYAYGKEGLTLLSQQSTLPQDYHGPSYGAAIHIHPNGRFLYASNRGHDSIIAYDIDDGGQLKPIGWYGTRGKTPRDFAIDPLGRVLVVANQDSHSLAVFMIDRRTGALKPIGELYEIGSPVCVLFAAR
ncbi:lactonase family protein [Aliirhizobium terrae]|uniref:lactonase family protein n=1 Tax=Terrirhizobium terrae TaxID=2926709 RepID=UPI002577A9BD|nr:lactonase family protein [Rhizobium sp. CC-CFT758]WJH41722.1 lactonase family protein [Rhizobium sp. CC-CFT758]